MMTARSLLIFAIFALVAVFADDAMAGSRGLRFAEPEPPTYRQERAHAKRGEVFFAAPRLANAHHHKLGPLTAEETARLNRQYGILRAVGVVRPVEVSASLTPTSIEANHTQGLLERNRAGLVWTTWIGSEGAAAIRVQIKTRRMPAGSRAYVYDASGPVYGPYVLASDDFAHTFWSNTVFSSGAYVEIQIPSIDSHRGWPIVDIASVAHLTDESQFGNALVPNPEGFECMQDAGCFTDTDWPYLSTLSTAVAHMSFIKNESVFICTGVLIADTLDASTIPYFLTANHCLDTQDLADNLETFWNYRTASCSGEVPDKSTLPRVLGATLLATDPGSDFTFLRLPMRPNGAWSFGWTIDPDERKAGTRIYRIGHPFGRPLSYSEETIPDTIENDCRSHVDYVFSIRSLGTSGPGGSGSPAATWEGRLIGQLGGICGDAESDPCGEEQNYILDGWLGTTFPYIEEWLDPNQAPKPCEASPSLFCAQSGRFEVTMSAKDPRTGTTDSGEVVSATDVFGYYAFPTIAGNTTDPQVFVKVLDGRPINNRFWVFYAALTDVEFTLTVRDTRTGTIRTYYQAPYDQTARNDTDAFQPD